MLIIKSSIDCTFESFKFKWQNKSNEKEIPILEVGNGRPTLYHHCQTNMYQVKINTSPIHACHLKRFGTKKKYGKWHFSKPNSRPNTVIRFRRHVETYTIWTFHIGIVTHTYVHSLTHSLIHWHTHIDIVESKRQLLDGK